VVTIDHPSYESAGFAEAVLMNGHYRGIAEMIEGGLNPLAILPLNLSQSVGGSRIRTRLFHRLLEQLMDPEEFSDASVSHIQRALIASLAYKPSLDEPMHLVPNNPSLMSLIVHPVMNRSRQPTHEQIKENQWRALQTFLVEVTRKGIRPANRPVPLRVRTENGELQTLDFNLLAFAVQNGMEDLIGALIEAKADPHLETSGHGPMTAFNEAIVQQDGPTIIQFLKAGANINRRVSTGLGPRPLHMIPGAIWKNRKAPDFVGYTKFLLSLGLDPFLGSGDPNHNLPREVRWQHGLEAVDKSPNIARMMALEIFLGWLQGDDFARVYAQYAGARAVNRSAFPDDKPSNLAEYQAALKPILDSIVNCPSRVADIARQN
jgi:hypothetical protein